MEIEISYTQSNSYAASVLFREISLALNCFNFQIVQMRVFGKAMLM